MSYDPIHELMDPDLLPYWLRIKSIKDQLIQLPFLDDWDKADVERCNNSELKDMLLEELYFKPYRHVFFDNRSFHYGAEK